MGYGVLPFAIEKDSVILYRENSDNIIRIRHEDNTKYQNIDIKGISIKDINENIGKYIGGKIEYFKYILAGIKSVLELGY